MQEESATSWKDNTLRIKTEVQVRARIMRRMGPTD